MGLISISDANLQFFFTSMILNRHKMLIQFLIMWFVVDGAFVTSQVWKKDGRYSRDKVSGGEEDRTVYYVCRAEMKGWGRTMCGKMHSTGSGCTVTWFDSVTTVTTFEVLITPPDADYTYEWSTDSYRRGDIPSNAVNCSSESYVGRKRDGGNWYLGKIDTTHGHFYYGKGEDEKQADVYNALMKVPRSITKQ